MNGEVPIFDFFIKHDNSPQEMLFLKLNLK